jgi:hypothetical protein
VNYFNTRNNMTNDTLAYVSEMQLLTELALGEDCTTVSLVTMFKNSEGAVIGKLLGNKYFQLYKDNIYSSFPTRNIFSAILLHLINTSHISIELHIITYVSVRGLYHKAWLNLQLLKHSHYPTYVRVTFCEIYSNRIT